MLKKSWKFSRSYHVSYFKVNICISYITKVRCLWKIKHSNGMINVKKRILLKFQEIYFYKHCACFRSDIFPNQSCLFLRMTYFEAFCLKNICIFYIFYNKRFRKLLYCIKLLWSWSLTCFLMFQRTFKYVTFKVFDILKEVNYTETDMLYPLI